MSQIDTYVLFYFFYLLYNDGGQDGYHNSNSIGVKAPFKIP